MNLYGIKLCRYTFCHLGTPSKLYEETSPNWIPSLKLGWDAEKPDSERYYRAEQRKRRKLDADVVEEPTEIAEEAINLNTGCVNMVDVACETDDCPWMLDKAGEIYALQVEIAQLKEEKYSLQTEVMGLKKKLQRASLSAECLENDSNKLKFYTGNNKNWVLLLTIVFYRVD